ncbi:hypothetical protein [Veillonella sp. R32]|uniref:hypothetical protein n=1 Tax=Veillonella sp. R32 TaxID=2021312 RepID=UPI001389E598|nr:hypothetical protein [Veillonella sp. R32]KAF1683819.1 hypothetical protein VER_01310 [Veillonella sp. R32]
MLKRNISLWLILKISIVINIIFLICFYINSGVFKENSDMIVEVDNYNIQVLNNGMVLDFNQKKDNVIALNAKAYKIIEETPIGSERKKVLIVKTVSSNEKDAYLIYREAYNTWYFIDFFYTRLGPFTGGIVKLNDWKYLEAISSQININPQMTINDNVKSGDEITVLQINELKNFIKENRWIIIK